MSNELGQAVLPRVTLPASDQRRDSGPTVRSSGAATVLLFGATLFASATLLFAVQPMVGKLLLPKLGGTPAVWNTCMVFFQAVLLAGYAYAHGSIAKLGVRRQAVFHIILLLVPIALLPIAIGSETPPAGSSPVGWLLVTLAFSIGLPFFVVSSTAPLLQRWFSETGHRSGGDPYFLYAASNVGSLLALVAYPLIIERYLDLEMQAAVWKTGYLFLVGMCVLCAIRLWRSPKISVADSTSPSQADHESVAVTNRERLRWVVLAFVPSSLMLGVTTHITTDVAAVPLLWVAPLALYLLTFALVFSPWSFPRHRTMVGMLPYLILPLALLMYVELRVRLWLIPIHLATFFVAAMVCHGELARRRPGAQRLTEFYLLMSVGGVLGGIFNAMLAPVIFTSVIEYPLMLVAACLLRPTRSGAQPGDGLWRRDVMSAAGFLVLMAVVVVGLELFSVRDGRVLVLLLFVLPALVCFAFKERPMRFGVSVGVLFLSLATYTGLRGGGELYAERNFFGVKRVVLSPDGATRMLVHGGTDHGRQSTDPARSREPSSYYHRSGPVGDVFTAINGTGLGRQVGVIGLGTGAMAAYAQHGDRFTFYEIDPGVQHIARDAKLFTFLQDSYAECEVVLGDGRIEIAGAPDGHYGLLILDAFSADAVPTHLLTKEAVELYLSKLRPDGMLVFNISNRYLSFEPMIGRLAKSLGLRCLARVDQEVNDRERTEGKMPSHFMAMARRSPAFDALAENPDWYVVSSDGERAVWTDRFSDLVGLLR
jgi:hypothetical protein